MIAYKGTDKNMKCRGFQYELGKEYETGKAKACNEGFHACEYPLDVFGYYNPADSRFFVVEQDGELSRGDDDTKVASTKIKLKAEIGIAGMVKAAVEYTMERATPVKGGRATGDQGAASATGDQGAASATGTRGAASATGDQGAASATGEDSVALAAGYRGKALGALGCVICCVERGEWNGETYPILAAKAAVVDGEIIKADTWYTLKNGEFVEV